jgi:hypothetical protein
MTDDKGRMQGVGSGLEVDKLTDSAKLYLFEAFVRPAYRE